MTEQPEEDQPKRLKSGVPGLDEVLCGGLLPNRVYLLEGKTGTGKTTLSLQFLRAGVEAGEKCLFVTLSETEEELRASAASHGWTLDGIDVFEVFASQESLTPDSRYTMYHPSEVELAETFKSVMETARHIKPKRLVLDSLTELRLLADDPLRYRRQVIALKRYFREKCTILLIDDRTGDDRDTQLHSIAQGLICVESVTAEYGSLRRRLQVKKLRGCSFREGYHDFVIRHGGLEVFPRLPAADHHEQFAPTPISSGVKRLDDLLGGGLPRGTSTLIVGPAGSGKTSLATQYVTAAAARGERSVMFVFDESLATLRARSAGLQLDLDGLMAAGSVTVRQVDPATVSPGEFTHLVRRAVKEGATMVVLDSLTGYLNAMPSEHFLTLQLHELLTYLGQRGVTTLVLVTQHGIVGGESETPTYASYLADTVVLLRYFEAFGEIRQAVSVIKKRIGTSEKTIRELKLDNGILVGEPITDFEGVLSGTPRFVGKSLAPPENGGGPLANK